ncbi:TspO/MBR family protein [Piscinibacter sakaiensis]|uniref:Tryptophan-rich sensory protein n=1 Tax=Piscinibacter sakaiensis TaxID=1547922 RepID=A0A0K8P6D6_PISS1|nr:TspO/MBR family protein [Piscinibacter sakaiensis]GAP38151.1 tryptophan-rich sensory protein [Piscinibacter sakaiensis]
MPSHALPHRPRQALGFAGWLALCIATSAIGALASVDARSFYAQLAQPAWSPPGWVFGPVWSVLFLAMAVAAWLVWRQPAGGRARTQALGLFVAQLAANALWSWLFFGWRLGGAAFAEVLLLWALVAATMLAFWRQVPAAGWLFVPYLAWVSFASALNLVLWRMNPGLLG